MRGWLLLLSVLSAVVIIFFFLSGMIEVYRDKKLFEVEERKVEAEVREFDIEG